MKNMTYNEFIDGINDPNKIKQINFYIDGYNHYRNCSIGRYREKIDHPVNKMIDYEILNSINILDYSMY